LLTKIFVSAAAVFWCVSVLAQSTNSKSEKAAPAAKSAPPMSSATLNNLLEQATTLDDREISVLVAPGEESILSSQMAGKIKKIHFGLGDTVKAGELLLEFDCESEEAQLQTAQADYRGARESHLTKMRLQALGAAGELEVTLAAAAADKARSQVNLREAQMAFCKVTAPFSGSLVKLRIKTAESVSAGQPLIEMVNPSTLKAQIFVPAAWSRWIRVGTPVMVKGSDNSRPYRARISKLNARVEGVSQSLELEARFDGAPLGLLPGMVGTATFPGRPKN
jgi:membrane fusion protein (multidrug efflux system)